MGCVVDGARGLCGGCAQDDVLHGGGTLPIGEEMRVLDRCVVLGYKIELQVKGWEAWSQCCVGAGGDGVGMCCESGMMVGWGVH